MWSPKQEQAAQVIAILIVTLTILASAYIAVYVLPLPEESPPEAYRCPHTHNETTDYTCHTVTFVVIDTWGNPMPDMLVDCYRVLGDNRRYIPLLTSRDHDKVTQDDGSCCFPLTGRIQYHIIVYNATMDVQKDFKLYPTNSCYLIILQKGGE